MTDTLLAHTPGPWHLSYSTIKTANGATVARIVKDWGVKEKTELLANAALVANAPRTLATLINLTAKVFCEDDSSDQFKLDNLRLFIDVHATINAARGQS